MTSAYIVVPVAIREDEVVRLHFPADITPAEASKVARVIAAYACTPNDKEPDQ
jgi:hypothetical protein